MAYETVGRQTTEIEARRVPLAARGGAGQAFSLLYFVYVLAPIVAGIDKFFHYLVDWNIYVSPAYASVFGGRVGPMMEGVGVFEIIAGLLVAFRPRLGGVVVALWLWAIIINLLLIPGYYDIALRDFGLSLGALALSRLSVDLER